MSPGPGDPRRRRLLLLLAGTVLGACAPQSRHRKGDPPREGGFRLEQLAKGDLDMVAEIQLREILASLRLITDKLYRRNPREWRGTGLPGREAAVARIFEDRTSWEFADLQGREGTEAIYLAFREDYAGDRVLALMAGLARMVMLAFDDKTEFFLPDQLNPQAMFNAARNVEIALWKLNNNRTPQGTPWLLANELDRDNRNISFEREFGKVIAGLDAMAYVLAEKTGRSIARVIQSMATAIFLPIP